MSLKDILKELEKKSFSLRDKGAQFELLIKNWFLTTKLYSDNIKKIWLWDEFPYRDQFGGSDSGIDLVLYNEEDEFVAIQCKFYKQNNEISKSDVDTFISTSAKFFEVNDKKRKFSSRIFVSTTNKWSKRAENLIKNQEINVQRISRDQLEDSDVDWSKIYLGNFGKKAKKVGKILRKHQKEAINSVHEYFKNYDRGKLIMACGTGKTFTSLKIAENETNKNGLVLFLVPSISLLGQTLQEWSNDIDINTKLYPICICSDSKISKKKSNDNNMTSVIDLALPATTDIEKIVNRLEKIKHKKGMKVVFSTYQSIDTIAKAQKELLKKDSDFGIFDLIICDEAHRTTGVTLKDEDESNFVKVHNNEIIESKKRLYMTATPRLYNDSSKSKAKEKDIYLCSMDDETIYGKEIYRIGFGKAVEEGLLTDYKVLVLTLNDKDIPKEIQNIIANGESELKTNDASKFIGCINGLSKQILDKEGILKDSDPEPMKRAVAFCQNIKISKQITKNFEQYSSIYTSSLSKKLREKMIKPISKHIDGTMNSLERNELLSWLKEKTNEKNECKILTNARCLSEGIDVPSLDAILFLSPKNSQVDVVQAVGRVMRKFEGKKYGYIIVPVFIPSNKTPEEALEDNETYKVVWSILKALRSHDDRFNAEINKIDLNKKKPKNILIGGISNNEENNELSTAEQLALFPNVEEIQNAIYAKMVEKVGDRKYFEKWAKDISKIVEMQIDKIKNLIDNDLEHKKIFNNFLESLKSNISPDVTEGQAIEMLSQHIITKPIFEALFKNYSFVKNNPISKSMEEILNLLLEKQFEKDTEELKEFYRDVEIRIGNIDNAEGKQKIILELYNNFFKTAFPKLVEKLGIVYTPTEIVDFIINSVEYIMNKEFERNLSDKNVNILDPFTGTGTFISRLLQSKIIKPKDLERKYKYEIYANEIILLAYYIAAVNIENIYYDLRKRNEKFLNGEKNSNKISYAEFEGICLTDSFQLSEDEQEGKILYTKDFKDNLERVKRQKNLPLKVIIGNPPYSIGQKSANDNAQNTKYPRLDKKIAETYSKKSSAGLNKSLYDAYIKAFRWATDRLGSENGIIGFVTNGSWIDGNAATGFRKSIEEEFSEIYIFNLRGDQRTSGELSRREGGKVFGAGSRAPIAITFLVKNLNKNRKKAKIYYHDIGDYLSREEKLNKIKEYNSIKSIPWKEIKPSEKGDWINHRNKEFNSFIPLFDKDNKNNKKVFFNITSNGIVTNRDPWVYSFSRNQLKKQMKDTIGFYNKQVEIIKNKELESNKLNTKRLEEIINTDTKKISWSRGLKNSLKKLKKDEFENENISMSLYRPFVKQNLYFSKKWIENPSKQNKFKNQIAIGTTGTGIKKEFSLIILNNIGEIQTLANANYYPLKYTDDKKNTKGDSLHILNTNNELNDGITDFIHNLAKEKYGVPRITKEDIFYYVYGFLHDSNYRKKFKSVLKKEIPRLPLVEEYKDFKQYSDIGKELANLHLNYEKLEKLPYILVSGEEKNNFTVEKIKFISKEDKSVIIFNSDIKISNIPLEVYNYQVNGKSAIEWIIERYSVTLDEKSGIVNDPNLWCIENKNPRYILDLLLSVITLSVKTNELLKKLPKIEFQNQYL